MLRLRPRSRPRWPLLLVLGWLLLAGQLAALLHPLAHGAPGGRAAGLEPAQAHAHAHTHGDTQPDDAPWPGSADAGCGLCLACAAAGHLALAAPFALPAPVGTVAPPARRSEAAAPAQALDDRHNRGPPAAA